MTQQTLTPGFSLICTTMIALFLLMQAPRAEAQLGGAGEILRAGTDDANLLMENYLKPFGAGFGADLNSGWVNTASPYRVLGFDLRANAAISFVPETDQLFSVSQLESQLKMIRLQEGSSAFTPTVSGDEISGARLSSVETFTNPQTGQTENVFDIEMPQGTGFPYVPAPMAQLTVGIVNDTDVSVRYFPTYDVEDVASIGMWGLGVKHGLNQWLPGGSLLPVDISVQAGYTQLSASGSFDVKPQIDANTHVPEGFETNSPRWDGQGIELKASGFTGNLLVGKTIPIISIYGGVGFQTSVMNIRTPGSYPVTDLNNDPAQPKTIISLDNPVDLTLNGANSLHALAGFRIRLAVLTISGSYTHSEYPVANLGLGISIR